MTALPQTDGVPGGHNRGTRGHFSNSPLGNSSVPNAGCQSQAEAEASLGACLCVIQCPSSVNQSKPPRIKSLVADQTWSKQSNWWAGCAQQMAPILVAVSRLKQFLSEKPLLLTCGGSCLHFPCTKLQSHHFAANWDWQAANKCCIVTAPVKFFAALHFSC